MQLAVLLAVLCSSTGVSAFRMPPPRNSLSPYLGLVNPTAVDSRPSTTVVGALHRTCSPAPARRGGGRADIAAVGGRSKIVPGSLLCGTNAGSSGGDEIKADGSAAEQRTGDSSGSSSDGGGGKPANLLERLGSAGLLAYGLLNGLWYCSAIAYLMLGPMGAVPAASAEGVISASVKQLGKVMSLVWLGSQATKPLRLALAALTTPAADKLIVFTQRRLRLSKKKTATTLLVSSTFLSTIAFCLAVIAFAAARATVAVSPAAPAARSSSAVLLLLGLRKGRGLGQRVDYFDDSAVVVGGGGGCGCGAFSSLPSFLATRATTSFDRHDNSGALRPRRSAEGGRRLRRAAARALFRLPAATTGTAEQQQQQQGDDPAGPGHQQHTAAAAAEAAAPAGKKSTPPTGYGAPARRTKMSPQKAADRNPPPQDNIQGWNEHPNHLLGLWEIGRAEALPGPGDSWAPEAVAAAAPSVAAAASLAAAAAAAREAEAAVAVAISDGDSNSSSSSSDAGDALPSSSSGRPGEDSGASSSGEGDALGRSPASGIEAGGFSYRQTAERDMIDLGSDVLHHMKYVVFRRGGTLKAGPSDIGVAPRSWRFTPASRRILFEVDVPARGITLRYSAKLKRLPGRFTRAKGIIRVRPTEPELNGDRELPSSSRLWPKLASFSMELDLPEKFRHKKRTE